MEKPYEYVARMSELYSILQDELSKDIFQARLAYDLEPSQENEVRIAGLGEQWQWMDKLMERMPAIVQNVERDAKKLILYGTSVTGKAVAARFIAEDIPFYGFCGRRAKEMPDGLMGKPVISPDELFQHPDDFYVILTVVESNDELMDILKKNHFPWNHVQACFKPASTIDHQYFEFPSLFHPGTAFIDGGALNCRSALIFADWCKGKYSKIFSFEPDPKSGVECKQRIADSGCRDIQLIQAGLSDHDGEITFQMNLYGSSHIIENSAAEDGNTITVPVATIDSTVGEEKIGFIKMDIEGSEFDALHGGKKVIVRDKPLLAISIYHRKGDMLAIMDYLHRLVPEYHFWLRHYSSGYADTVLYASTDILKENQ